MRAGTVPLSTPAELAVAMLAALCMLSASLCNPQPAAATDSLVASECVEVVIEVVEIEPYADPDAERVERMTEALYAIAELDDVDLDRHVRARSMPAPAELADAIVEAGDAVGVDPIVVALVAWNESRLDPSEVGGDGAWCGIAQILATGSAPRFPLHPTRPTCEQAVDDWRASLTWGAALLASTAERPECDGSPCLMYYWGEGEQAGRNERVIWRRANTLRARGVWP